MFSIKLYSPKRGVLKPAPGPACDQCRQGKARCNRQQPCLNCKRKQIRCCYDAIPKARGRRPRVRPRTESSNSPNSVGTLDINDCLTDASISNVEDALEVLSEASAATAYSQPLADDLDVIPELAIHPVRIEDCNTSPALGELDTLDTSSDGTSPISLQRFSTVDSFLNEDIFAPRPPHFEPSGSGLWTGSEAAVGDSQASAFLLPRSSFLPYVHIFFQRLYPVFPVVDKKTLLALLQSDQHQEHSLPASLYPFLAALSAAVIVQLNVAELECSEAESPTFDDGEDEHWSKHISRPAFSAQVFMAQCMQARHQSSFIEEPDEWTILTSFFLFAYHGNMDQCRSAWYYLREAIGFVQALGLDETETYKGLDAKTAQRRCRIFWLLFVTERAFAIQHRRRTILSATIDLPCVFDCQDPKLAYGFVTLARVFAAVDDPLIVAWQEHAGAGAVTTSQKANLAMAKFLQHKEPVDVPNEIEETQRLDILVTHYWLRVLVCQLRTGQTPWSISTGQSSTTRCVLNTAKNLLHIVSSATPQFLECHGIGMEQKVADVANCLCDILAALNSNDLYANSVSAPDILNNLMVFLSGFRNHESQYLRPLAQKATTALTASLRPITFPVAADDQMIEEEVLAYSDENGWVKGWTFPSYMGAYHRPRKGVLNIAPVTTFPLHDGICCHNMGQHHVDALL